MKGVPGQPHGARLVAAKFKVVSVQRLIVIAENGDAHENAAARLGPKCFVWTVNPFVLSLLFGSKPLLQTIDHFCGSPWRTACARVSSFMTLVTIHVFGLL